MLSQSRRGLILLMVLAIVAGGCSGRKKPKISAAPPIARPAAGQNSPIGRPEIGKKERGVASWYGAPYDGRRAADGETYHMEALVAAHRTLPFQTIVRVKNLENGKTVDVRIVDRGPFVPGRIIDLSHGAAAAIDMLGAGVAEVELNVIDGLEVSPARPVPVVTGAPSFGVQVGAFRDQANAERARITMEAAYGSARLLQRADTPGLWRVVTGRAPSIEAAEELAKQIREEQKIPNAYVVRLDP